SAANTNNVYAVAVSDSGDLRTVEAINVAMTPEHPLGMTPSALALSPDQSRLYVVCSDANAVAVVDVTDARSHVLGFVPTGWYPTAATALAEGRFIVLNGRGASGATGTASLVPSVTDESLHDFTAATLANSPYRDELLDAQVTNRPTIEHIIYILADGRTYDEVLGDLGKGAGDPSLAVFGEKVSSNYHKLAREFVLFDNFYTQGDWTADGMHWSTAAIATDYVEKLW